MNALKKELTSALREAVRKAGGIQCPPSDIEASFEVPREEKFGDLSTHLILKLAKQEKKAPRPFAESVRGSLESALRDGSLKGRIDRVAVEGPGFLNFYFAPNEIRSVISRVRGEGEAFGRPDIQKKKNILLEFVSANPTGPLTVAHGRQAALGDSLANILRFCGHRVTKEYYNNDEGVQIETLGKSLYLRIREKLEKTKAEFPEGYYRGDYLLDVAETFLKKQAGPEWESLGEKEKLARCSRYAKETILRSIQQDLRDFGVVFDEVYSQETLGKSGKIEKVIDSLREKGFVYEKEGAVWFASTRLGDDKDRVLVKSDKSYTYLVPDMAYHDEKFKRGFEEIINIWGPDHHGYIARLRASQEALGHSPDCLRILIAQLVTLYEGDKQIRMSTRSGEFITLREILDEVGKDAGRFFFVMRKFDAHLDFDLALAKSQTPENPVFYIQYAHARIESVKRMYADKGGKADPPEDACLERLTAPEEIRLLRLLSQYEDTIAGAERTLEPFRLVPYLLDLAGSFHKFYTDHRVVTEDAVLTQARLALILSVQAVLRSGLGLLGVTAPLKM